MIFNNAQVIPADEMVRNLLKSVKDSIHAKRMREREQFLDRYTGKNITVKIVEKKYFAPETLAIVALAEHNIVKRTVNREAMVYKNMPNTVFGDGDKQPRRAVTRGLRDAQHPLQRGATDILAKRLPERGRLRVGPYHPLRAGDHAPRLGEDRPERQDHYHHDRHGHQQLDDRHGCTAVRCVAAARRTSAAVQS